MQTLKFSIYDEFACTGPECEDSCCKHWQIFLTKREYLDYKKLNCSPELKSVIDSAFKRTRSGNDFLFAKMELRGDGSCPFLGEDRLCMLQKEKGEEALTIVCSAFPRNWARIGKDIAVFTLTPTCCHVVELLMKHPEGLALSEGEYNGENKWINKDLWTSNILSKSDLTFPYIWPIKTAQLDILQNRDFTIAERLLILGYYTKKTVEYLESSPEKIPQLGEMMLDRELCEKLAGSLKTYQTQQQAVARSVNILFKLTESVNRVTPESHLTKLVNVMADSVELTYGLNSEGRFDFHFNHAKYERNLEVYRKIEEKRSYITENLLATLAFSSFSKDGETLWADYFSLAVLYNFLKAGIAAFLPENYGDKELAMAMTNIVKVLVNAKLATELTMRDFAEHGINSLSYVAFLIS